MHLILHLIRSIVVRQKKLPNPLLDIPMTCLQTNTHLENLEVVEWADVAVQEKKSRLAKSDCRKEDDFESHPIFNFRLKFKLLMYCI